MKIGLEIDAKAIFWTDVTGPLALARVILINRVAIWNAIMGVRARMPDAYHKQAFAQIRIEG